MKIPGYCSMYFLDEVTHAKGNPYSSPDHLDEERYRIDLLDLIAHGLDIYTDVPREKILERLTNPYIKHLVKNLRINSSPAEFTALRSDEDAYFSSLKKGVGVYMLSATFSREKLQDYQAKSGYYFLSPATQEGLFEQRVTSFGPSEPKTWAFARSFLCPHHSLIIADPYLFKEATLTACTDLLREVVSAQGKVPYHLTLIGASSRRGFEISAQQVVAGVDKIRQVLTRKLPHSRLEHHVYNAEDFHDRYLITNNACVFSGYGLEVLKPTKGGHKESTWTGFKAFGKVRSANEQRVFFYTIMLDKLRTLKSWIAKSSHPATSNPLFEPIS